YVEDQDHWWQAGIQRDVYLYAMGTPGLQDVFARGDLSGDLSRGTLLVRCKVGETGESHDDATVTAQLYDRDQKPVFKEPLAATGSHKNSLGRWISPHNEWVLEGEVTSPELWSAESPYLYTLVVTLKTSGGEESVSCRVGFRKIEIRDRHLLINGKRVFI